MSSKPSKGTHLAVPKPFHCHRLDSRHRLSFHLLGKSASVKVARRPNFGLDLPGSLKIAKPPVKKGSLVWLNRRLLPVEGGCRQASDMGGQGDAKLCELHVIAPGLASLVLDHHLVETGSNLYQRSGLQDAKF